MWIINIQSRPKCVGKCVMRRWASSGGRTARGLRHSAPTNKKKKKIQLTHSEIASASLRPRPVVQLSSWNSRKEQWKPSPTSRLTSASASLPERSPWRIVRWNNCHRRSAPAACPPSWIFHKKKINKKFNELPINVRRTRIMKSDPN